MYVRVFLSAIDQEDLAAVQQMFDDDVRPALLKQSGCTAVEWMANMQRNAGGLVEGASVSRWRSLDEMEQAFAQREVQESIVRVRQLLRQEPVTKTYEVVEA